MGATCCRTVKSGRDCARDIILSGTKPELRAELFHRSRNCGPELFRRSRSRGPELFRRRNLSATVKKSCGPELFRRSGHKQTGHKISRSGQGNTLHNHHQVCACRQCHPRLVVRNSELEAVQREAEQLEAEPEAGLPSPHSQCHPRLVVGTGHTRLSEGTTVFSPDNAGQMKRRNRRSSLQENGIDALLMSTSCIADKAGQMERRSLKSSPQETGMLGLVLAANLACPPSPSSPHSP